MKKCNSNKSFRNLLVFSILFFSWTLKSQIDSNSVWKPFILSNHPLLIFNSRMNHNFNFTPRKQHSISTSMSRGNVWLPKVDAFHLTNQADQEKYKSILWHIRQGVYEESITKPNSLNESMEADGIFTTYHFEWSGPITKQSDFNLSFKTNQINGGKPPYSLVTSDAFLEWFHSNIAGGEDPFARKKFDYNQINLFYSDKNNNVLSKTDNSLFLTEFGTDMFYYPNSKLLNKYNLKTNIGVHAFGSVMNSMVNLDLGLALSINKVIRTTLKSTWTMGISISTIAPKVLNVSEVEIQDKLLTNSLEAHWNYIRKLKKGRLYILGINYHLQNAINSSEDLDHAVLAGDRESSHWNYAIKKLYEPLQGWTFINSIKAGRITYSTFFREDFVVDNSPDFQVGWGISFQL